MMKFTRVTLLSAFLLAAGASRADSAPNHSGLWWNPDESGWGVAVEQQGDVVSAVVATYDPTGQPVWFVMPRAQAPTDILALADSNASAFRGTMYRTTGIQADNGGPALFPPQIDVADMGDAIFTFNGDGQGTFSNPLSTTKAIDREVFAADASSNASELSTPTSYQGLWADATQPGWGLYFAHQGDVVFGLWLTYAPNGTALWYSMPLAKTGSGEYSGPIVFSMGPGYDQPYDAARVTAMEVGDATVSFDTGDNAHFTYRLTGLYHGERDVSRIVFGSSATPQ
ncbi:MAG: hypothetical protein ACXWF0_00735 [Usitatibacter sp.]